MGRDIENLPSTQGILEKDIRQISEATSIMDRIEIQYFEVLGDLIKSIVGAILVDSEFNIITVWTAMKRLLDSVVTPKSIRYHPIHEFTIQFPSVFPFERIVTILVNYVRIYGNMFGGGAIV